MAIITKNKTWVDNEFVLYSDINADFDTLYNEFNGNIDNNNVKTGAAIVESKIAFSTTGHSHNGTDSKLVPAKFGFFLPGTASIANDLSWNPLVPVAQTATKILAYVKTAPTGAGLTVQVYNVSQAVVVASLTIAASASSSTSTSMTNASMNANDVLRVDITAVGSTVPGADVTVILY